MKTKATQYLFLTLGLFICSLKVYSQCDNIAFSTASSLEKRTTKHLKEYRQNIIQGDTIVALCFFEETISSLKTMKEPVEEAYLLRDAYFLANKKLGGLQMNYLNPENSFLEGIKQKCSKRLHDLVSIDGVNEGVTAGVEVYRLLFDNLPKSTSYLEAWLSSTSKMSSPKKMELLREYILARRGTGNYFYKNKSEYVEDIQCFINGLKSLLDLKDLNTANSIFVKSSIALSYSELFFSTKYEKYVLESESILMEIYDSDIIQLSERYKGFYKETKRCDLDSFCIYFMSTLDTTRRFDTFEEWELLLAKENVAKSIGILNFYDRPKLSKQYLSFALGIFNRRIKKSSFLKNTIGFMNEFQWYINVVEIANLYQKTDSHIKMNLRNKLYEFPYSKFKENYSDLRYVPNVFSSKNLIFTPNHSKPVPLIYYNYRMLYDKGHLEFEEKILSILRRNKVSMSDFPGDAFLFLFAKNQREGATVLEKKYPKKEFKDLYVWFQSLSMGPPLLDNLDFSISGSIEEENSLRSIIEKEFKIFNLVDEYKRNWRNQEVKKRVSKELSETYNELFFSILNHYKNFESREVPIKKLLSGDHAWKLTSPVKLIHELFFLKVDKNPFGLPCFNERNTFLAKQLDAYLEYDQINTEELELLSEILFRLSTPVPTTFFGNHGYEEYYCDSDTMLVNRIFSMGQELKKEISKREEKSCGCSCGCKSRKEKAELNLITSSELAKALIFYRINKFDEAFELYVGNLNKIYDGADVDVCFLANAAIKSAFKLGKLKEVNSIYSTSKAICGTNARFNNPVINAIITESQIELNEFSPAMIEIKDEEKVFDIHNPNFEGMKHRYRGHRTGTKSYFFYKYDVNHESLNVLDEFEQMYQDFRDNTGYSNRELMSIDQLVTFLNYYSIILRIHGNEEKANELFAEIGPNKISILNNLKSDRQFFFNYKERALESYFLAGFYKKIYDGVGWSDEDKDWFKNHPVFAKNELNLLNKRFFKYQHWKVFLRNYSNIIRTFEEIDDVQGELNAHYLWFMAKSEIAGSNNIEGKEALIVLEKMEQLVDELKTKGEGEYSHEQIVVMKTLYKQQERDKKGLQRISVTESQMRKRAEKNEKRANKNAVIADFQKRWAEYQNERAKDAAQVAKNATNAERKARRRSDLGFGVSAFLALLAFGFYIRSKRNYGLLKVEQQKTEKQAHILSGQKDELEFQAKKLREQKEELELQAQKLREQNDFIFQQRREIFHRVANNFENLGKIVGLQQEKIQDKKAVKFLDETKSIIQNYLLIHKLVYEAVESDYLNFSTFLDQLTSSVQKTFEERVGLVAFDFNDVEPIPFLSEKATALGMIMNELLVNSFDHGFDDDERIEKIDPEITIKSKSTDSGYILEYWDNGSGFDEEKIFEASERLGFGIITYQVEKVLKGNIYPQSSIGKGAYFKIVFEKAA